MPVTSAFRGPIVFLCSSCHTQESSKNLRERFRQLQGVLVIVQSILGFAADLGERVLK